MESLKRFEKIKKDYEKIPLDNAADENIKEFAYEFASVVAEYQTKIQEKATGLLLSDLYREAENSRIQLLKDNQILEERLRKLEEKEEKRKRYFKKQRIKSKK